MTKLKNTKKGMAKKALSISLVAAMLATSNVPVWAAEFTDGTDAVVEAPVVEEAVDTFSAEAEAPVVEEEVNDVATYAATADAKLELKDWTSALTLTGDLKDAEGNKVTTGIKYNVRIDGMEVVDHTGTWKDSNGVDYNTLVSNLKNLAFKNTDADHTVTVDVSTDNGFSTTLGPVAIEAADITGKVVFDEGNMNNLFSKGFEYSGKQVAFTTDEVKQIKYKKQGTTDTDFDGLTADDFEYIYEGEDLVNVTEGSKTVTVIAKVTKEGYKGTVTKTGIHINQRDLTNKAEELEITLNKDNVSFAEQKTNGTIPSELVTVKDTETGDTFPASTYEVKFNGRKEAGDKNTVSIVFNGTTLAKDALIKRNYKGGVTKDTKGTVEVKASNLSDFTIKVDDLVKEDYPNELSKSIKYYLGDKDVTANVSDKITIVATPLADGATSATVTLNSKDNKNVLGSATVTVNIALKKIQSLHSVKVNGTDLSGTFNENRDLNGSSDLNGRIAYTGEELVLDIKDVKTDNKTTLSENDYKIVYEGTDRTNANAVSGTEVKVKIVGTGDYTGAVYIGKFKIAQAVIEDKNVTVPKTVQYDGSLQTAADYMDGKVGIKATTYGLDGKEKLMEVPTDAYTLDYTLNPNRLEVGSKITTTLNSAKITNKNFKINSTITKTDATTISNKSLADENVKVEVIGGPYTYTGKAVIPTLKVTVDGVELALDRDYKVMATANSIKAGKASVLVLGMNDYSGSQTVNYTIEKAKLSDLKVEADIDKDNYKNTDAFVYTGKQVKPVAKNFKITLNGVTLKSDDFAITYPTTSLVNVDAGEAKVHLVPVKNNENFTGDTLEVKFEILPAKLSTNELAGKFYAFDENGNQVNLDSKYIFQYDGTEKTFKTVKYVLNSGKGTFNGMKLVEGKDYEIKYFNNITGPTAHLYVTGMGNYVGSTKFDGSDKTYVDKKDFTIEGVTIDQRNMTLKDTEYAGGVATTPNLTIKVGEKTLVEGTDYKFVDLKDNVEVTPSTKVLKATLKMKAGYELNTDANRWSGAFDKVKDVKDGDTVEVTWKIVKKDLANTKVVAEKKADDLTVTVYNGNVIVPEKEYDVKDNGDGTVTVTAKKDSKNYTGTQKVTIEEMETEVGKSFIKEVKVVGNKATVVLEGDVDGATGYDFVVSTNGQSSDKNRLVNKNVLATETTFQYLQQGIYYAHCHAWKKVNGKKVFGEYSEAFPFSVTAITPDQPSVTSVKVSKNTVKVTYTKSANATGYDLVLGKSLKKVNGEMRPVEYGKLVKKVYNGNTVTATFTKVPKGTYYVGLHAYNRTSENGKKVFSPWSNAKKVVVK